MTQYNSVQYNITELKKKLSPNMIGDSNDGTNILHKLSLTDRNVSILL